MDAFLKWFESDDKTDKIIRAALAHLWLVTMHPFDDGNGRIARAIADMALARAENSKQRFYSMSAQIRAERNDYYDILERTQKAAHLDVTNWLSWFLACLDRALDGAKLTGKDIDLLIPHQANMRIIEATAKHANISMDKVYVNVDRYGNTSSASVPIALDEALECKRIKEGMKVMLVAFGAGFTWGSMIIQF